MTSSNPQCHAAWAFRRAACIGILASLTPAYASQFEAIPVIDTGVLHETNPRLDNDNEDDATGLIVDGRLNMEWASERTQLAVLPRARFGFYADSDDKDLEDKDYWLRSVLGHQSQLSTYEVSGGYSDVAVRSSEVESAGGDPSGSGGFRRVDDSRETWDAGGAWSRQLTPLDRFSARASYTDVSFDRRTSGRVPYEYKSGSLTYERTITSKWAAGILFDASRFESKADEINTSNTSDTLGFSGFANYAFTPTVTGSVYAGRRTTDIEIDRPPIPGTDICFTPNLGIVSCNEKTDGQNFVGTASLSKQAERTSYDLSINRSISPNSNGAETLRDTIDVTARHQFTRRLTGKVGLLYFTQEDAADLTNRKRDYVSAQFDLNWRMTEYWSIRGAYRYVNDKDDTSFTGGNINEDATNNYFYVGVRYQGQGWRR